MRVSPRLGLLAEKRNSRAAGVLKKQGAAGRKGFIMELRAWERGFFEGWRNREEEGFGGHGLLMGGDQPGMLGVVRKRALLGFSVEVGDLQERGDAWVGVILDGKETLRGSRWEDVVTGIRRLG